MSLLSDARSLMATGASMPGDLLEDSRKRIGAAAIAIASIWLVILLLIELAGRFFSAALPNIDAIWPEPGRYFAIAGVLSAAGVAYVARRVGPRSHWLRDVAALLTIGTCLMLALLEAWVPIKQPGRLSWVCIIILLYPLIVTDSPRRTLVVSIAAATTVPLAFFVARLSRRRHAATRLFGPDGGPPALPLRRHRRRARAPDSPPRPGGEARQGNRRLPARRPARRRGDGAGVPCHAPAARASGGAEADPVRRASRASAPRRPAWRWSGSAERRPRRPR